MLDRKWSDKTERGVQQLHENTLLPWGRRYLEFRLTEKRYVKCNLKGLKVSRKDSVSSCISAMTVFLIRGSFLKFSLSFSYSSHIPPSTERDCLLPSQSQTCWQGRWGCRSRTPPQLPQTDFVTKIGYCLILGFSLTLWRWRKGRNCTWKNQELVENFQRSSCRWAKPK